MEALAFSRAAAKRSPTVSARATARERRRESVALNSFAHNVLEVVAVSGPFSLCSLRVIDLAY